MICVITVSFTHTHTNIYSSHVVLSGHTHALTHLCSQPLNCSGCSYSRCATSLSLSLTVPVFTQVSLALQAQDQLNPPAVRSTSCTVHVWLLVWAWSVCRFVGELFSFWAAQCVWTGVPPGRHTQSGSLKVLWHRWHPFFSDTTIGPPRYFICTEKKIRNYAYGCIRVL